jgi:hypothetical protein
VEGLLVWVHWGAAATACNHQPPEVNYWAVLTFGEIKQEVHSQVYPAGEIDFCENLDIVHFWWLVEHSPSRMLLTTVEATVLQACTLR